MDTVRVQALRRHGGQITGGDYRRLPRDYRPTPKPPHFLRWEDHFAPTADGLLFLKRIRSESSEVRVNHEQPPVILFPPFGCNGNIFRTTTHGEVLTLDTDDTFANFLAASGLDVFVIHPLYCERIYRRYVERFVGIPYQHAGRTNFVTMLNRDVPAATKYVLRLTGSSQVDWVGFSMGGMLMYAHLGAHPDAPVRRVVAIGSPIEFRDFFVNVVAFYNAIFAKGLGLAERSPLGLVSDHLTPLTWLLSQVPGEVLRHVPILRYLFYPDNTNPAVVTAMFQKVIENPGAALTHSFWNWIYGGRFPYTERMAGIRTPFLLISGEKDRIARVQGVQKAARALGSACVEHRVVKGMGHIDSVVGKNVRAEVWEPALKFLNAG